MATSNANWNKVVHRYGVRTAPVRCAKRKKQGRKMVVCKLDMRDIRKRAANPPCPLPYSCGLQSGGCGWRCPTMGQQLADSAIALGGQAGQHIFEIRIRIMPIEPGALNQTHDGCTPFARAQ